MYLDRALGPDRDANYRHGVLNFLVSILGDENPMKAWAEEQLKLVEEVLNLRQRVSTSEEALQIMEAELLQEKIKGEARQRALQQEVENLSNGITRLRRELREAESRLGTDLSARQELPARIEVKRTTERDVKKHSEYSVLIFYRDGQKQAATVIEKSLRRRGYRSSRFRSELRESIRQFPSGNAWIIYTERGEEELEEIKATLDSLGLDITLNTSPKASTLRRGEIQVLLF